MQKCYSCGLSSKECDGIFFEEDWFVCNRCIQSEVKQNDLERVVRSVIRLLNSVGFEDITYDNFECRIVTKSSLYEINKKPASDSGYVGLHEIASYHPDEHGISGLKEIIYIIQHLSELNFRETIAHEILHSWQTRNYLKERFADNDDVKARKICEGFAQMGKYLVLNDFLKHKQSNYVKTCMQCMMEWDDPYYGVAFQKIYNQFQAYPGSERQKWLYIIKCARQGKLNVE